MFGISGATKILNGIVNRLTTNGASYTNMPEMTDDTEEMEEETVKDNSKGFINSIKGGTKAFFESYKGVRRISLFFLLCANGALLYVSSLVFLKSGKIDPNWVSIVEIYSSIMTIVICYYFHLRAKDIKTAKGTVINNVIDEATSTASNVIDNETTNNTNTDTNESSVLDNSSVNNEGDNDVK